jgi:CRP/FNR family cyclic AMP-dependent transcriptional regulator
MGERNGFDNRLLLNERALFAGGEVALFDGRPRTADAIAAAPTECVVLERSPVRDFLLEHPRVALRLLEVLAARTRWPWRPSSDPMP